MTTAIERLVAKRLTQKTCRIGMAAISLTTASTLDCQLTSSCLESLHDDSRSKITHAKPKQGLEHRVECKP